MRSLTLLRHAKTERDSPTGRDFDRRLTDRGRRDAERMGHEIRNRDLDYDLVVASPARRSAETVEYLGGVSPVFDESIYNATPAELAEFVRSIDAEVTRLMLVGHNPGFEQLASQFLGGDIEMPTASLVEIELPTNGWREVSEGSGRLVRFLKPKELD